MRNSHSKHEGESILTSTVTKSKSPTPGRTPATERDFRFALHCNLERIMRRGLSSAELWRYRIIEPVGYGRRDGQLPRSEWRRWIFIGSPLSTSTTLITCLKPRDERPPRKCSKKWRKAPVIIEIRLATDANLCYFGDRPIPRRRIPEGILLSTGSLVLYYEEQHCVRTK